MTPVTMTATVEEVSADQGPRERREATVHMTVAAAAPGAARLNTFLRKLPLTRSLLGSKARMKEGRPTVRDEIRVSWMGLKG